jgi:hypothetical protein
MTKRGEFPMGWFDRFYLRGWKVNAGLCILVFAASFLIRLYHIDYRSVWMDEDFQGEYSRLGVFDPDMPVNSAAQNQPPLDPAIQAVGISNFGLNEIGLRIHSAVLGSLAVLLFFLMMGHFVPDRFAVILTTIIFAFHPLLVRYSQEGRPTETGVFFAVLYLFTLFHFLEPPGEQIPGSSHNPQHYPRENRSKQINIRNLILLVIVQTWFLLSIGFQPLVFLLVSSISLLPFLFSRRCRLRILLVYLSSLISFFLAYPILYLAIRINGKLYLKSAPLTDRLAALVKGLYNLSFGAYATHYKTLMGSYIVLYAVISVIGILGLVHAFYTKKRSFTRLLFLYFIIFMAVYPPLFHSIFYALINYRIRTWYFLCFGPVLIAALAFGLYYSRLFLSGLSQWRAGLRLLPRLAAGFFLILFIFSFYGNTRSLMQSYRLPNREWRELYTLFKERSSPGDTAYILNLAPPGAWQPKIFYAQDFYYQYPMLRDVRLPENGDIVRDYPGILNRRHYGNIYIVVIKGGDRLKKSFFKTLPDAELYEFYRLFVVRLPNNGKLAENILAFYYCLAEHLPRRPVNYMVYETLFSLEMINGRRQKAGEHLETLEHLDPGGKLKDEIDLFKKVWQGADKKEH